MSIIFDEKVITTSINWVPMLGGEVMNLTGPCITPDSVVYCRFDTWKVVGRFVTENIVSCIVPPLMYEGID